MSRLRLVDNSADPVRIGNTMRAPKGRTWQTQGAETFLERKGPMSELDRLGYHATTAIGAGGFAIGADGASRPVTTQRLLTSEQYHLIYQRTPDVRACIDSIVRRVSTQDWDICPYVDPSDADFEDALTEAVRIKQWLSIPNADGETFQELCCKVITDLLKFDAGVVELVGTADGKSLSELVALRGCDVHPVVNDRGRLLQYIQEPRTGVGVISGGVTKPVILPVTSILYLMLFPTTEHPEGIPLLESLVYEIMGILRAAEHMSVSMNMNEIPPGLLVVTGIAADAADKMRDEYEAKAAQDWKIRILSGASSTMPLDAKWVEFRRMPRDLQIAEISKDIRRSIWRVFGVKPIELGETEGIPRASAEVQVDVGGSHLLTPILELVAAKLNARVIERVVDPKWAGRIGFEWLTEREMTAEERKARAEELGGYVDRGILSRNEVRDELGYAPDADGDVLTVITGKSGGIMPLDKALTNKPAPPAPPGGGFPDGGGDDPKDGTEDDKRPDSEDSDTGEDSGRARTPFLLRGPVGARSARSLLRAGRDLTIGPDRRLGVRAVDPSAPPKAWGTIAADATLRTVDLTVLWEEMLGYERDVIPLWEEARAAVIMAMAAEYTPGDFDAARRERVMSQIIGEAERLLTRWTLAVSSRYERVAMSSRAQAGRYTGVATDPDLTLARARAFRNQAMGYLDLQGGLISDLRLRLLSIAYAITSDRATIDPPDVRVRLSELNPTATASAVLSAVAASFDSLRSRVRNWTGKLVELANQVFAEEADAAGALATAEGGGGSIAADAIALAVAEPWVEWICVHDDRSCDTCRALSARGFMRLGDLPTYPGGDTECRSNCRCVLVIWQKGEIDDGTAHLMSGKV